MKKPTRTLEELRELQIERKVRNALGVIPKPKPKPKKRKQRIEKRMKKENPRSRDTGLIKNISNKYEDLTGKTFGDFKVIERVDLTSKAHQYWVECICGAKVQKSAYNLVIAGHGSCLKCSRKLVKVRVYKNFPRSMFKGDYERSIEREIGDDDWR